MKYSSIFRRYAFILSCVFLFAAGYMVLHTPAYAQAQTQDQETRAEAEAQADKNVLEQKDGEPAAADVAAEKTENTADQGEKVAPAIDNEQAQDVRPQDEQNNLDAAVDANENAQPRIGMAHPWQLGMQAPVSPIQEKLYDFHHALLILITVITIVVLILLVYVCVRFSAKNNPVPSKTTHNVLVEVVWTLIPILILAAITPFALKYLYYMDHSEVDGKADLTIKIVGYQWYWNYEYPDSGFAFDSYIIKEEDLKPERGDIRLLSVDNELVVPVNKKVLLQLTGGDVIHAWAMPSFGVKIDAVPGHLNQTWFEATELGTYYGQCSELCGVNHGFMPIKVRVVTEEEFKVWLEQAKAKFASVSSSQQFAAAN